jgi:hypothetical protein
MKDWQKHLVTFLIGAGAAMCLCLTCNPRVGGKDVLVQSDTIVKYETLHYSRLELAKNTIKLDVPKVSIRELVFIEESSLDTIYRDSIRYVTLAREYFYTKQDDVEIWHSGIDSRIDSLKYTMRETIITDTYKRRDWKHEIKLYGSAGYKYNLGFSTPVGAEYTYYPKRWVGIGGKAEYDFAQKTTGVYATMNFRFGW